MMVILNLIQSEIIQALIIAAIIGLAAKIFTPKGKLVWGVSHQHFYKMPIAGEQGTFPVVTQQIWFQNLGSLRIDDVEIVINYTPQHFEIWFPREWDTIDTPDKRFIIKVPSLSSKELFTLSMIDTRPELPAILNVRYKDGIGKIVKMRPQRIFPTWVNFIIFSLLFTGLFSILFILMRAMIYLFLSS